LILTILTILKFYKIILPTSNNKDIFVFVLNILLNNLCQMVIE